MNSSGFKGRMTGFPLGMPMAHVQKDCFVYSFHVLPLHILVRDVDPSMWTKEFPNHYKYIEKFCVGVQKETKEPPDVFGKLSLTASWPEHRVPVSPLARLQTNTHSRTDQVAQLSQVQLCLCSLGNYGKYYCSLLPLTLLCWCTYSSLENQASGRSSPTQSGANWAREIPAAPDDLVHCCYAE